MIKKEFRNVVEEIVKYLENWKGKFEKFFRKLNKNFKKVDNMKIDEKIRGLKVDI